MKYIQICLCFFYLNIYSQNVQGKIIYNVVLAEDKLILENKTLKPYYEKAIKLSEKLKYELIFNGQESLFRPTKSMDIDGEDLGLAKVFADCDGEVYVNSKKDLVLYGDNDARKGIVLKKEGILKWNILSDKKVIMGYECYKATVKIIVENHLKKTEHQVIAWYCPEIPISFGPKGYYGLPGLIIELVERNVAFGVKSINLKNDFEFNIKVPDGEIISEKEYNKKSKPSFSN